MTVGRPVATLRVTKRFVHRTVTAVTPAVVFRCAVQVVPQLATILLNLVNAAISTFPPTRPLVKHCSHARGGATAGKQPHWLFTSVWSTVGNQTKQTTKRRLVDMHRNARKKATRRNVVSHVIGAKEEKKWNIVSERKEK